VVLIAVGDRRPLAKVLIAVAALASVSVTDTCRAGYYYNYDEQVKCSDTMFK
jgi:hypothetical protein